MQAVVKLATYDELKLVGRFLAILGDEHLLFVRLDSGDVCTITRFNSKDNWRAVVKRFDSVLQTVEHVDSASLGLLAARL